MWLHTIVRWETDATALARRLRPERRASRKEPPTPGQRRRVRQEGRYTAPTAAPDGWWFPVPLAGQSATKATTPTSPTLFCQKIPPFPRFPSFDPAEVPAVARPIGAFPDPSALKLAVHVGTARDFPIRHPMNPIPTPLAVNVGTFLDFPIPQPLYPIPMPLAVNEGTFRDSQPRPPQDPIPMLLAVNEGTFRDFPTRPPQDPIPMCLAAGAFPFPFSPLYIRSVRLRKQPTIRLIAHLIPTSRVVSPPLTHRPRRIYSLREPRQRKQRERQRSSDVALHGVLPFRRVRRQPRRQGQSPAGASPGFAPQMDAPRNVNRPGFPGG